MAIPLALSLIVTVAELRALPPGSVTLLDARGSREFRSAHLPGARRVDWKDYRDGWGRTGRLPADLEEVAADLAGLGVDEGRPVVVYGAAREGWGEEGRIAWMLLYLGHPDVRLLDGGLAAWAAAGAPVEEGRAARPARGRFHARPVAELRADGAMVAAAVRTGSAVVLDVRSLEERNGATPYGEARGGHIPGSLHLPWAELLDPSGGLDRSPELRERLAALGVTPHRPVIAYCTGGVRSGEAVVLLKALGYPDVRNYDGSFWEWAADDARPVARP